MKIDWFCNVLILSVASSQSSSSYNKYACTVVSQGTEFYISLNRHVCLTLMVDKKMIHHWIATTFLNKKISVVQKLSWTLPHIFTKCALLCFWEIAKKNEFLIYMTTYEVLVYLFMQANEG